jgi:hypothetical protein
MGTLGNKSTGTTELSVAADEKLAFKYNLSEPCQLTSVGFYAKATTTNGKARFFVYNDKDGVPYKLLFSVEIDITTSYGSRIIAPPTPWLLNVGSYWLGLQAQTATGGAKLYAGTLTSGGRLLASDTYADGLDAQWATPGTPLLTNTNGRVWADYDIVTGAFRVVRERINGKIYLEVRENGSFTLAHSFPEGIGVPCCAFFFVPGELVQGEKAGNITFTAPFDFTIEEVHAAVDTAPGDTAIIVDVNLNGTTIFTTQGNRPQIASTEYSDTSGTPELTAVAKNDVLTIDLDQIGSAPAGSDLAVEVRGYQ